MTLLRLKKKKISIILCNKSIIVHSYKLHFPSSHFSLNQTKENTNHFYPPNIFYPSIQTDPKM